MSPCETFGLVYTEDMPTDTYTYTGQSCTDCAHYLANGEAPIYPVNLDPVEDHDRIRSGDLATEEETTAWVAEFNRRSEGIHWTLACGEDCEGGFSSTPCTTCGSTLGGDRHPVAGWSA